MSAKKAPRRIVPMLSNSPVKANIAKAPPLQSVYFQDYMNSLNADDYLKELHDRAVKREYEKPSKRKKEPKKAKNRHHAQFLTDKDQYVIEYLKLKRHAGTTLYGFLMDQLKKGKYYNHVTHRFNKAK